MNISTDSLARYLTLTDDLLILDADVLAQDLEAARAQVSRLVGFRIYAEPPTAGTSRHETEAPLVQAVLMLAAHYYDNRDAPETPAGVLEIVREYRDWTF